MAARFDEEYNKLNKAQKEAVDSIDGPVMVIAGPGTGKTQVLSLRVGNILLKTDTAPDGVLCLTFTNAGVSAMRERLREYIGAASSKVNIFTFHSFAMKIIEEYYPLLDLHSAPKLLDETDRIALCDQVLKNHAWQYISPRGDATRYFRDLKSLISLLKRERVAPDDFLSQTQAEINNLKESEDSISSRGESKGQLKKDVLKKIESLERTAETVKFYEFYEEAKKETAKGNILLDYDDVLEYLVKIMEESEEARDEVRERYLYVLIDEHQDSSGVQNEFLEKVWGGVEKPNIFVVGDDRQLIYGFGGASLEYFENFKHAFGKTKLITLSENYRSTQVILDSSHALLESSITKEKLVANLKESHPIRLIEADYPRDEIIACALDIKQMIKEKKIDPNDCAILVPKNKQVRSTVAILRDMGLPVSAYGALGLFSLPETYSFLRVLKIIANPYDSVALAESFFDRLSGIPPLEAHKFIKEKNMKKFSLANTGVAGENPSLFQKCKGPPYTLSTGLGCKGDPYTLGSPCEAWLDRLSGWLEAGAELGPYALIQKVGDEFLLQNSESHEVLVSRVEIIRTILHLALSQIENNPKTTLTDFLEFVDRLESYDEHIPLAVFSANDGVKVLTLHSSKGLEFDYVWIAHMDERSFSGGKRQGFTLPPGVEARVEKKNEEVLKRQLYVAITRAKRHCFISYALHSHKGVDQELAGIIADLATLLDEKMLSRQSALETEKKILEHDPRAYVEKKKTDEKKTGLVELSKIVASEYVERNVSVSLLNNFFECPWKWYFRNLLQLPEEQTDSLEFGNAIHASIDKILRNENKLKPQEIADIVSGEISKKGFWDDVKQEQMKKEALAVVSRWVKERLPDISLKRENEKSVSVKDDNFPHLNIYGKIDLVERLDKEVVRVTDFKTGSVRKKSDIEKMDEEGRMSGYMRQLAMYSYLLTQSSKGNIDVRESRLEFVETKNPKDAFYNTVISGDKISLLLKDIKEYDELVKKGAWTDRPCNYNSYGKDTECEYCKRAKIYQ